jgi:hypothetical protein
MKSSGTMPRDGTQGVSADTCMRNGLPAHAEWQTNAKPATAGVYGSDLQREYEMGKVRDDDDVMLEAAGGAMLEDMADAAGGMAAFDLQSMAYSNERVLQDRPVCTLYSSCTCVLSSTSMI